MLLGQADAMSIVIVCGALILLVVVGSTLVMWVRRQFWGPDHIASGSPHGFTLGDLRQLHKSGQMTTEEYDRARALIVEGAKKAAARQAQEAAKTTARK